MGKEGKEGKEWREGKKGRGGYLIIKEIFVACLLDCISNTLPTTNENVMRLITWSVKR